MSKTVNTKILLRNDTYSNWQTNNPTLAKGEIGAAIITQNGVITKNFKIGDGVTPWNDLSWDGRLQEEILEGILRTQKRSGSIVTFDDGADAPLKECICQINPVQDLHGQDAPYPAGGGGNIYPLSAISGTSNGVTLTQSGDNYVLTGTATAYAQFISSETFTLKAGTYYFAAFNKASGISGQLRSIDGATTYRNGDGSFTLEEDTEVKARIAVNEGIVTNRTINLMIVIGSTAPSSYAPYSNICPITGWDGVTVQRCGKNMANFEDGYNVSPNGTVEKYTSTSRCATVEPIKIVSGETYYVSFSGDSVRFIYAVWNGDRLVRRLGDIATNTALNTSGGTDLYVCAYDGTVSGAKPMVTVSSLPTAYESYQGDSHSLSFPQTVYGGYVDVIKGELHVTHGIITDMGTLSWGKYSDYGTNTYYAKITGMDTTRADLVCSIFKTNETWQPLNVQDNCSIQSHPSRNNVYVLDNDVNTTADFNTAVTGQTFVYELAHEIIIPLDPVVIKSRQGFNTIWTNADNLELEYYKQNFQESVNDVNHFDIYINPQDDENLVVAADMTNPNSSIWINPNGSNFVMPNVNVSKSDNVTTVTTTNNIGTTNSVEIVDGVDGITPNLTIGTVETLPYNLNATVEITGTQEEPVLNFGIPGILTYNETGEASIASFSDGADDMPCKSVVCQVDAVQDLHGQDAPYPAGGAGNVWDEEWEVGSLNQQTGENYADSARIRTKNYIAVQPNTKYYFLQRGTVFQYGSDKSFLGNAETIGTLNGGVEFTTSADTYYLRWFYVSNYGTTYNNNGGVNYPSTITAYHPYSNLCPITGWDGVTIVRSGKNLLPVTKSTYTRYGITSTPNNDGSFTVTGTATALSDVPIAGSLSDTPIPKTLQIGGKTFKFNGGVQGLNGETGNTLYVSIRSSNGTSRYVGNKGSDFTTFTLAEDEVVATVFVRVANGTVANAVIKPMIVDGSETDTTFEPYSGSSHSISFPQTVYGGWVDVVKGELHVTHGYVDLGTLTWSRDTTSGLFYTNPIISGIKTVSTTGLANIICSRYKTVKGAGYNSGEDNSVSVGGIFKTGAVNIKDTSYTDSATFKTAMSGVQLVYELAQETIIPLDPVTIKTLLGNNNVYADTGGIRNVIYPVSSTLYNNITAAIRIGEEIEDQLQEMQEQINSVGSKIVTVNGTDVSITGEDNTIYVCGEVSTISITPPQTGIINVLFTSGTSKAILTLPNTVKMPEWFVVEEDQTYEISILNGVYGTVMSWAN